LDYPGSSDIKNLDQLAKMDRLLRTVSTPPITMIDLSFNDLAHIIKFISQSIRRNSTLTSVNLSSSLIGPDGGKFLAKALQTNSTVTQLKLYDNGMGNVIEEISETLLKNNLLYIDLSQNMFSIDGARLFSLVLGINTTITHLDLSYNNLGKAGAQLISRSLQTNSTLTYLNLASNQIGDAGMPFISLLLRTNTTLTTLNISSRLNHSLGLYSE